MNILDELRSLDPRDPGRWPLPVLAGAVAAAFLVLSGVGIYLLVWDEHVWLIDHGAALYVHHDWDAVDESRVHTPFPRIREHVLITRAGDLAAADGRMLAALDAGTIDAVLEAVPDALLAAPPGSRDAVAPDAARERYRRYLLARLAGPRAFVAEAAAARDAVRSEPPRPLSARR